MNISFIICTFNRSFLLGKLLSGFVEGKSSLSDSEILVVNNNCTDDTSLVVESFASVLPIRECREKKQGIVYARNRGLMEASGRNLVFLDDDVIIESQLVSVYTHAFSMQPDMGFFGGRLKPYWPQGKPKWVKDENLSLLRGIYGNHDYGTCNIEYNSEMDSPFGASFGIRKSIIDKIGRFNEDLSRGEETDLIHRAKLIGSRGMYLGEACGYHKVQRANTGLLAVFKTGHLSGQAHVDIYGGAQAKNWFSDVCLYTIKCLHQLLLGRGDRARQCLINIAMISGARKARLRKVRSSCSEPDDIEGH